MTMKTKLKHLVLLTPILAILIVCSVLITVYLVPKNFTVKSIKQTSVFTEYKNIQNFYLYTNRKSPWFLSPDKIKSIYLKDKNTSATFKAKHLETRYRGPEEIQENSKNTKYFQNILTVSIVDEFKKNITFDSSLLILNLKNSKTLSLEIGLVQVIQSSLIAKPFVLEYTVNVNYDSRNYQDCVDYQLKVYEFSFSILKEYADKVKDIKMLLGNSDYSYEKVEQNKRVNFVVKRKEHSLNLWQTYSPFILIFIDTEDGVKIARQSDLLVSTFAQIHNLLKVSETTKLVHTTCAKLWKKQYLYCFFVLLVWFMCLECTRLQVYF